ncbi:alpha/beta hydrolase [Longimicrobium terrae]|uniref:Putative esterase n=2 Tax=Longimicrobium terrae TaxID=1639882 RepID=A0A841H5Y9_9BACT|nr:dienelactone hydrolase family protein [Longimicrobium terrae]MBB4639103.1 putative esterase [Longimicrobium terrae]MBB6073296.1 putative esterase [Longimicrobium terrae]NNC28735.1 phospholipase [Longimicrobium terrae]
MMTTTMNPADPHAGRPMLRGGAPLESARGAMIMVHGRGGDAAGMMGLARELDRAEWAYLAPQAAGNTWYPYGFMSPIAQNEPGITSGMNAISRAIAEAEDAGIPAERIVLLGFSQGACLATEFAARHARRYGGVAALSGGVIGPDSTPRDYAGSFDGTPVFLGCSDVDGHIPAARVRESAEIMRRLGGEVDLRLYPGMGHTINLDEVEAVRAIMDAATRA